MQVSLRAAGKGDTGCEFARATRTPEGRLLGEAFGAGVLLELRDPGHDSATRSERGALRAVPIHPPCIAIEA
jgi:hypothetical protein